MASIFKDRSSELEIVPMEADAVITLNKGIPVKAAVYQVRDKKCFRTVCIFYDTDSTEFYVPATGPAHDPTTEEFIDETPKK